MLFICLRFNYNYGTIGVLDWFHGTDSLFKKMAHYKRHRLLTTLTPLREQYPDPPKTAATNGHSSNGKIHHENGTLKQD